MKIHFLIYALFFITLSSCTESIQPENPLEQIVEGEESKVLKEEDENPCTKTAYQVYRKTVQMWEQSWKWDNNISSEDPTKIFFFSGENLNALHNLDSNSNGVRMYYCLINEGDSIPSLALVNMNNCNDLLSEGNSILIANGEGGEFIEASQAAQYTENWRNSPKYLSPFYLPINGYNYNWDIIQGILDYGGNIENRLYISLGLRTISPADSDFESAGLNYGAIALVNILHGSSQLSAVNHSFDFTMPCPQMCDSNGSILNSSSK